ncbi:MAG: Xaa-Pro aminopeptidase [Bacteroidetes bacterium]|nr:MAG: Xaa-Pro aminopeptidase [Bacteroidota bacterium]
MKRPVITALFCALGLGLFAQDSDAARFMYDKDRLSKEFHAGRRDALRRLMPDSSVAVFFANPERNRANDVDYQYHQDPNFYYLTGLEEPNAMLFVFKEKQHVDTLYTNEIIFVQGRDQKEEAWTGRRLGTKGVRDLYGLNTVLLNTTFADMNIDFAKYKRVLFSPLITDLRDDPGDRGDLFSMIRYFRNRTEKNKNNENYYVAQYMAMLRQIKQPEEMVLLRKAIDMSCIGHIELIKALEDGMNEYEAQAVIEYVFKKYGAEYCGYPSIVGGGENSCILHYISNRRPLTGKDMLVVDAGAEYHGYTADITRTLPTDGKYSDQEKAIYNIVLEAQEAGIKACRKGNEFRGPHKEALKVIQARLKELGIIKKDEECLQYFFHGTSHYLGLDVHDPGLYGKLEPGNVITVEPGIYIPEGSPCDPKWWNIGIRIEDDVLITDGDPDVLSKAVPKTVESIEKLMEEKSYLNQPKSDN